MSATDATLKLSLNGAALRGTKRAGRWTFQCRRWPDLARRFDGAASADAAIEAFTERAVRGAASARGKRQ